MKKLNCIIITLLALCTSYARAGSGKAIVPIAAYGRSSSTAFQSTTLFLTNLTDHSVKVTVTFYGKDGSLLSTSLLTFDNWTNSNTEIGAKKSAYVILSSASNTAFNYGKAIIEWENLGGDDDSVALVAHGSFQDYAVSDGRWTIPVNSGLPF